MILSANTSSFLAIKLDTLSNLGPLPCRDRGPLSVADPHTQVHQVFAAPSDDEDGANRSSHIDAQEFLQRSAALEQNRT